MIHHLARTGSDDQSNALKCGVRIEIQCLMVNGSGINDRMERKYIVSDSLRSSLIFTVCWMVGIVAGGWVALSLKAAGWNSLPAIAVFLGIVILAQIPVVLMNRKLKRQ